MRFDDWMERLGGLTAEQIQARSLRRLNSINRNVETQATADPRQEFEIAIGTGKLASDLSAECIRAIRNALPFASCRETGAIRPRIAP